MVFYRVRKLYFPEHYQGPRTPQPYFEGWYYKFVFPGRRFAIIPGVSWAPDDPHAFVQWLDGDSGVSHYHRYPVEAFRFGKSRFWIEVADNRFSLSSLAVDIPSLKADAVILEPTGWPTSVVSPGTMGPYSFVPKMECNHAVLVMDATAAGSVDGVQYSHGRCYVEKDWGRSFPKGWVWAQSNSFTKPGVSVTCSVARVPFRNTAFAGFLIGLLADGRLHQFTTYNGARVERVSLTEESVDLTVERRQRRLSLTLHRAGGTVLAAPHDGAMTGRIMETLDAEISVSLEKSGTTLYEGVGSSAGLEVVTPGQIGL